MFTLVFKSSAHKIRERYPGIRTGDDIILGISSVVVSTSCVILKKSEAWQKNISFVVTLLGNDLNPP